jgi:hypothetical protein
LSDEDSGDIGDILHTMKSLYKKRRAQRVPREKLSQYELD